MAFAALMALPLAAHAQDTYDDAEVEALYDLANDHMEAENYGPACPLLEEVTRRRPKSFGGTYTLGVCYEKTGRFANAIDAFRRAQDLSDDPVKQQKALDNMRALQPRVARLVIVVPKALRGIEGLQVLRDGTSVASTDWNVAVPIDLGNHRIRAIGSNRPTWEKQIDVAHESDVVVVEIEVGEPLPKEQSTPPAIVRQAPPATTPCCGGEMVAAGTILSVIGGVLAGAAIARPDANPDDLTGEALLGGGLVGIGVGLPLLYFGAQRLRATGTPPTSPVSTVSSSHVDFFVGPSSAMLRATF